MEDLWNVQNSTIEAQDFTDMVEYKRYLDRFCKDEETRHQRRLLDENNAQKG
jgi:hypothetical protein